MLTASATDEGKVKEARIVAEALHDMGEPVKIKDLVELTKESINWEPSKGQSNQMLLYMKRAPIEKVGRGLYEFSGDESFIKGDKEVAATIEATEDEEVKEEVIKIEEEPKDKYNGKTKDDDIVEIADRDKELLKSFRGTTTPPVKKKVVHKVGDIIEGRITGVEDYGAFICNDDESVKGLVHITNIVNGVTDDVHRHFKVGDVVKAKVTAVKGTGKLALSTKDFKLPDYFRNEELEEKLQPIVQEVKDNSVTDTKDHKPRTGVVNRMQDNNRDDFNDVYKFVQGITGVVSDQSKDKIKEMIEQYGLFKFTLALSEAKRSFEVDVSMLFAKEIETKMRDGL